MAYGPDFEWKTPDIREAEAQVDRSARAVQELAAKIEREGLPTIPQHDPEDIARRLAEEAGKPGASAELKAMKRKVDEGKFSWTDVVKGRVADDPDVRKAQEANMKKMQAAFKAFEEGHTLQDIINADAAGRTLGDDDDDDGDGNIVLRDRSW
jgi:hypothetical protein